MRTNRWRTRERKVTATDESELKQLLDNSVEALAYESESNLDIGARSSRDPTYESAIQALRRKQYARTVCGDPHEDTRTFLAMLSSNIAITSNREIAKSENSGDSYVHMLAMASYVSLDLTRQHLASSCALFETLLEALAINERVEEWNRVKRALLDPKWDFRTIDGIADETGIKRQTISELLEEHQKEIIVAPLKDKNRRVLYTSKEHRGSWRRTWWLIRAAISRHF